MPTDFDAVFEQELTELAQQEEANFRSRQLIEDQIAADIPRATQNIGKFIDKMRAHNVQSEPVFKFPIRNAGFGRFGKSMPRPVPRPTGNSGWKLILPRELVGSFQDYLIIMEDRTVWLGDWVYVTAWRKHVLLRGDCASMFLPAFADETILARVAANLVHQPRPL